VDVALSGTLVLTATKDTYRRQSMELNATIIVQLAVILTLMLWLSKVLFGPLLRLFDEREARIQGAKAEAQALEGQSADKAVYIDERMKRAQKDAREILSSLKAEGAAYQRQLTDKARSEAREKMTVAKERIHGELEKARSEMAPFVDENAKLLVAKFLSPDGHSAHKANATKMEFRNA
jgi:F-type H+-transporting ATPase subunit b